MITTFSFSPTVGVARSVKIVDPYRAASSYCREIIIVIQMEGTNEM